MPIYIYTEDRNDPQFENRINEQIPDAVVSVDPGELNAISVNVPATSKDDLDQYLQTLGFSFLHTATVEIDGTHHWGRFTTANEPTTSLVEGDTGYDTTLSSEVWYDGSAWTNDVKTNSVKADTGVLTLESVANDVHVNSNFEIELNSASGDIIATASSGTFQVNSDGAINFLNTASGETLLLRKDVTGVDTDPMLRLINPGTNGGNVGLHISDRDPVGQSLEVGTLWIEQDGSNTRLHMNVNASSPSTNWREFAFVDTSCGQINRRIAVGTVAQAITGVPAKVTGFATNERSTGNATADQSNNEVTLTVQDTANGDIYYANVSGYGTHANNERYIIELIHNDDGVETIIGEGTTNTAGANDSGMFSIPDVQFTTGTTGTQSVYANVYSVTGNFTLNYNALQLSVHK